MRFAFTDDQTEFRDAVRDLLTRECPPAVVRAAWENADGRSGGVWDLLAEMGVDAETVADGQALVAAWREQGWDAMLVDIQGPAVCGRSLIREIRVAEAKARWPRTPMIVLSTAPSPDRDDEFAQMIDCALAKPIDATALHAAKIGRAHV